MSSPAIQKADTPRVAVRQSDGLTTLFGSGASSYAVDRRSFLLAYLFNTLVITIFIYASWWIASHKEQIKLQISQTVVELSPYVLSPAKDASGGGGGGGDRDKLA